VVGAADARRQATDAGRRAALTWPAVDQNPDQAAVHQALAKRYNTTPDVVAAYPQEFKDRMALELARSSLQDAPQLQQRSPASRRPAAIIHDDLPNAAGVERALTVGEGGQLRFQQGRRRDAAGRPGAGLRAANATVAPVFAKVFQAIGAPLAPGSTRWRAPTCRTSRSPRRVVRRVRPALPARPARRLQSGRWRRRWAPRPASSWRPRHGRRVPPRAPGRAWRRPGPTCVGHGVRAMMVPSALASEQTAREVMARGGSAGDAVKAGVASYLTNTLVGCSPSARPAACHAARHGRRDGAARGHLAPGDERHLPEDMQQPLARRGPPPGALGALFGGMAGPRRPRHDLARDAASPTRPKRTSSACRTLGQLSASSKWRERDPDGFRDFVRTVTEDGELANVYIDAHAFAQAMDKAGHHARPAARAACPRWPQMGEASMTQGFAAHPDRGLRGEDRRHAAGQGTAAAAEGRPGRARASPRRRRSTRSRPSACRTRRASW
jgi:hypothetical protein